MASKPEPLKILAPMSFRHKLSRRSLFQIGGAAAGLAEAPGSAGVSRRDGFDDVEEGDRIGLEPVLRAREQ